MMRLILLFVALSSCVRSSEVSCADGRTCPPGNTCDNTNHRCISPEQLAACSALGDGDDCTFAGVPGICHAGACDPLLCGDGVRTGTEACDGNDLGDADCTTAGYYEPAGLACTQFCTFDTSQCVGRCGDGVIDGPELCDGAPPDGACIDDGFDAGPLGCSGSCGASFTDCARFGWIAASIGLSSSFALGGTGPTDLWAVGANSLALHYDGGAWTSFTTNLPSATSSGVWAIAANDVWTVGDTGIAHWDGMQWNVVSAVPPATYSDVWAASATAVFAATRDAGVFSWNGTIWQSLGNYTGGPIIALRGATATDLWAADTAGTLWYWNGASWTSTLAARIVSISVVAADDVWVSGSIGASFNSLIAHWDGQTWTQWETAIAGLYGSITASAPNDAWVSSGGAMLHFDGTAWTETAGVVPPGRMAPSSFMSFDPGSAFGLSSDGLLYRYRGQSYVDFDPQVSTRGVEIWMDAGNDVFIADSAGHVLHYDGTSWTGTTTVVEANLTALFGTDPDNVWAGGAAGKIYRFNRAMNQWSVAMTEGVSIIALWGTGATDMWAFDSGGGHHYNGATWQDYAVAELHFVSGTSANDIWGVDATGSLWHWAGTSWDISAGSPANLLDVVAIAPDHVVAIDTSYAYTWNGAAWTSQLLPLTTSAVFVAGTAADDVVAASATEIVQFDGARWSPVRMPSDVTSATLIGGLVTTPNMFTMLLNTVAHPVEARAVMRTRPWVCETKETDCTNGVDDDCDGKIDGQDSDCP